MRIHHLNLCTMCPYGGRLVTGGAWGVSAEFVVHALLVETDHDLVLVETGMGLEDVRAPARRLGRGFLATSRPILREEQTAVRQIERLGLSPADVGRVVVTHLDPDHAGGLSDFPRATIHAMRAEHDAAT